MPIFGWTVSKITTDQDFLKSRQIDLVIDVGANVGQYAADIGSQGYRGDIFSFEPVSASFDKLVRRAKSVSGWKAAQYAIGAEPGEATINVSRNSVYSSIRELSDIANDFSRLSAVKYQETVEVRRLDSFDWSAHENIFLKIDTQGYEKEVLDGIGAPLLAKIKGMKMEVPTENLYKNTWNFRDVINKMDDLGFVPAHFAQVNPIHNDPICAIEFDCMFRRKL